MIERYTRPEMGKLWGEEEQFQAWLEVELAACAAWSEIGIIPHADVDKLYMKKQVSTLHASMKLSKPRVMM